MDEEFSYKDLKNIHIGQRVPDSSLFARLGQN
jgi:hypothetical protein